MTVSWHWHFGVRRAQLIEFCTDDTEPDPMRREGDPIPARQTLLRDEGFFEHALSCVQAVFDAKACTVADLDSAAKRGRAPVKDFVRMGTLAMRLAYHMVRARTSACAVWGVGRPR